MPLILLCCTRFLNNFLYFVRFRAFRIWTEEHCGLIASATGYRNAGESELLVHLASAAASSPRWNQDIDGRAIAAGVQMPNSLTRAIEILRILRRNPTFLTLTEVARAAGIAPSSAHSTLT